MTYKRPSQEAMSALSNEFQKMLREVFGRPVLCAMVLLPEKSPDYLIMGEGFLDNASLKEAFETAVEKMEEDNTVEAYTLWRKH